ESDREQAEDVLAPTGREAGGEAHARAAREGGVRRFADDYSDGHDVARRVAYEVRPERLEEAESVRRLEAESPGERAHAEAKPREKEYQREAPAYLRDVRPDFAGPRRPHEVIEQPEPQQREDRARRREPSVSVRVLS